MPLRSKQKSVLKSTWYAERGRRSTSLAIAEGVAVAGKMVLLLVLSLELV